MELKKYTGFLINENYGQAKKFLRDTYILNKALKIVNPDYGTDDSGLFIKDLVTDNIALKDIPKEHIDAAEEKIKEIEKDPAASKKLNAESQQAERSDFLAKIRNLAGKKLGYSYMYVYFILQEGIPFDEVEALHKSLMENNDLINLLRRNIANYIDPNIPNNFEEITDDMEKIRIHKKVKKFVNEFPSHLKRDFKNAPPYLIEKLENIANAFGEIGMEGGVINPERQKIIQRRFFDKMSRYRNLRDMAVAAENFLKAEQNAGYSQFQDAIVRCNDLLRANGVDVVFDDEGIIITEVKSFAACRNLFSNTSWCIKDSMGMWNNYVGENKFTKQYMINNFNLSTSDNKSIIGITIGENQRIRACHLKNDASASSSIMDILSSFEREANKKLDPENQMERGFLWSLLKPMTSEEIERKRRRARANQEVVRPNLTLEQLKQFILEDGADVNAGSSGNEGAALHNAVIEYEKDNEASMAKVKFLFEMGADPNIRCAGNSNNTSNLTINFVKDYEMLKMFVAKGAILTANIIRSLSHDTDAIKFCLDNGLDPNLGDRVPLRMAIKSGNLDAVKLLINYKADTSNDKGWMYYAAFDAQHQHIVDYFIDDLKLINEFDKVMAWVAITRFKNSDDSDWTMKERYDNLMEMQNWIDGGRVEVSENYRINIDGQRKYLKYDEILEIFGNVVNYVTRIVKDYDEFTGNDKRREEHNISR